MRLTLCVLCCLLLSLHAARADQYVYAVAGAVKSAPREIPSVGVRLDGKGTVLGLHSADDATKAACGWYRYVAAKVPSDQIVTASTYTLSTKDGTAVETITTIPRPAPDPAPPTLAEQVTAIRAEAKDADATGKIIDAIVAALDERDAR